MQQISRINHIGLRVSKLENSLDFYAKLGFRYVAGPMGPEPVAIVEHPSGININFILNAKKDTSLNILMDVGEKHPGYTHVALEITDADLLLKELEDAVIPLSGGPMKHANGRSYFVRDPDRNVIEFIEYNK